MSASEPHIRLATTADAAAIAEIYAPFVAATHVSFEEIVPSSDDVREKLEDPTFARYPWVVGEREGRVVAYAYASQHRARAAYRWSVDTSVYVAEIERGRGTGTFVYRALLTLLEAQRYGSAFAGIALPNDASIALHRSVGFTSVGRYRNVGFKAGAWRDTEWFQRALFAPQTPPPEPLAIDELPSDVLARAMRRAPASLTEGAEPSLLPGADYTRAPTRRRR